MNTLVSNLALMLGAAGHFILSGAALFGDMVIAPVVPSAPPASLKMFQAPYAYDSTPFWRPANMIVLGLIVVAVILNWKKPRKKLLLHGWRAPSLLPFSPLDLSFLNILK